jgi:hypothetical protein
MSWLALTFRTQEINSLSRQAYEKKKPKGKRGEKEKRI